MAGNRSEPSRFDLRGLPSSPQAQGSTPAVSLPAESVRWERRIRRRPNRGGTQNRLWVVSTQFNPAGYRSLLDNYNRFATHMRASGVNLLTAELCYPGQKPTLHGENVLHYEAKSVMWHKERLLNLAIEHLPSECDMVAWVDADVLFTNDKWVTDTISALERVPVVQMFEKTILMDPQGNHYKDAYGYAFSLTQGFLDNANGDRYYFTHGNQKHPGFAWAARRETVRAWNGLYDRHILGGGDFQMALAVVGDQTQQWYGRFGPTFQNNLLEWSTNCHAVTDGQISFVPGMLLHMWHGHAEDRQYVERSKCLVDFEFDPMVDIRMDESGLWMWGTDKPELHRRVGGYFNNRMDDRSYPVHPTRYEDKWPVLLDPEGGSSHLELQLNALATQSRMDFCVHICSADWIQLSKMKPLLRDREWPFQIRLKGAYDRPNREIPRRLQVIKGLGRESQSRRCIFVNRDTHIAPDFITRATREGRVAVNDRGRLVAADRWIVEHRDVQCFPCEHGQGEERVVNFARRRKLEVATLT